MELEDIQLYYLFKSLTASSLLLISTAHTLADKLVTYSTATSPALRGPVSNTAAIHASRHRRTLCVHLTEQQCLDAFQTNGLYTPDM